MQQLAAPRTLDLEDRIRRSRGRGGRVFPVTVKLTRAEREELESIASTNCQATGEWAREQLLAAARKPKEDVLLTELIGLRMIVVNLLKPIAIGDEYTEKQFQALLDHVRSEKRTVTREVVSQYAQDEGKA